MCLCVVAVPVGCMAIDPLLPQAIGFEAFHIFKIFVANPNKSDDVKNILIRNADKLCSFLGDFHKDKDTDENFKVRNRTTTTTPEAPYPIFPFRCPRSLYLTCSRFALGT